MTQLYLILIKSNPLKDYNFNVAFKHIKHYSSTCSKQLILLYQYPSVFAVETVNTTYMLHITFTINTNFPNLGRTFLMSSQYITSFAAWSHLIASCSLLITDKNIRWNSVFLKYSSYVHKCGNFNSSFWWNLLFFEARKMY